MAHDVERLLQLDTTIPPVMGNDDQCTVRQEALCYL